MPYVVGGLIVIVILYLSYLLFNYLATQAKKKAQAAKVMNAKFIQPDIDYLIDELSKITDEFPYPEFYSHEATVCFKIVNEFSASKKDVVVLCPVKDGFEKAMRLAIEQIQNLKKNTLTRLKKIKQIAHEAFALYSVRPARISFRFLRENGGVVAGKTEFVGGKSPVIYLDILCFIFFSFDDVKEVVLHEVSHVIHFYKYPQRRNINHGNAWKKIAISLGIKSEGVTKIKNPKKIFKIIWSCQKLFVRLHQIKN